MEQTSGQQMQDIQSPRLRNIEVGTEWDAYGSDPSPQRYCLVRAK